MPFTPFHLGPGALFKAVGGRRFSFLVFGGSQVLMDIEPLVRMARGDAILHGSSHTVLGALVVGVVSGALGKPISERVLELLGFSHRSITWAISFVSAFVGTYSHIVLDAIMHKDMKPLWPLTADNPLLGVIEIGALYVACVICGLIGVGAIVLRTNVAPEA